MMDEKRLKITETVLRDGQQSLIATRMPVEDMLPVLDAMDRTGYYSIECWGGATFDSCIRYLDEDPWERLRQLRKGLPHSRLQMLLRGQNLLGYRHYADDVVDYFVRKTISEGMDILRIFDCLNDVRNLETSVKAAKAEGGEVQLAMVYTTGDGYTLEYWVDLARRMEDMGADTLCIKDMSGLLLPDAAAEIIKAVKEEVSIPVQLHSHCTSGMAPITYVKAIEAGCDMVDTAISPFAMGTSQPPTEVIAKLYEGTDMDPLLDQECMAEVSQHFRSVMDRFGDAGSVDLKIFGVDVNTLRYQVPGGMLSNLIMQLKDQNASDKFYDVLAEIPRVRDDLGQPPLVTPSSQIVGTQALLNVLAGERYKMMAKETVALLHGDYGRTMKPFNPEVQHKAIGDDEPITIRPADLIEPELGKLEKELGSGRQKEEDILTYAMFPQIAADFFKKREAKQNGIRQDLYDAENRAYPI